MAEEQTQQNPTLPGQVAPSAPSTVPGYENTGAVQAVYTAPTTIIMAPVSQTMERENDWSSGLCGCCNDPKSLLCAMFCPSCFACNLATRFGDSWVYGCLCYYHLMHSSRVAIRYRHKIRGNLCDDAIMSGCCCCLSLLQVYREMDHRGEPSGTCFAI
uniref:cornifelin homolog n=1 Tax=Styela clava TaxID=7725 RepID=UPI0019397B38|nr:cornifelin homolog [Styela clava]